MSGWAICYPRCRTKACRRPLAPQNRSGWCWRCADKSGRCAECWKLCDRKAKRCAKCHLKRAKDRARTVGPCSSVGCERRTKAACGMCRWHRNTHRPCEAEGCAERVTYYSTTGLCRAHRDARRNDERRAARVAERERRWRASEDRASKRGRSAGRRGVTANSGRTTARASASRTTRRADSVGDASRPALATTPSVSGAE